MVAGGRLWESGGIRRPPGGEEMPHYMYAECKVCGAFRFGMERDVPECTSCGSAETRRKGRFISPRHGFVGKDAGEPSASRPRSVRSTKSWFGSYRDAPPDFERVDALSKAVTVSARTSSQGMIVSVNEGIAERGFQFCRWCGSGRPAPLRRSKDEIKHQDLRRPGRECGGTFAYANLGHDFLTDVVEIGFQGLNRSKAPESSMLSVLHALLAAAPALGVARDDVDGTLHSTGIDVANGLVLFDSVAGGAGHAHYLHSRLPDLFDSALYLVSSCDCDEASSCYG